MELEVLTTTIREHLKIKWAVLIKKWQIVY